MTKKQVGGDIDKTTAMMLEIYCKERLRNISSFEIGGCL